MTGKKLETILYPPIEPFKSGHLKTDAPHEIYWELSGNPNGQPVMALHGGPGGGSSPATRRFFDPDHYLIIQHDQRGCGKSRPQGCLTNNTTAHLINDINKIADLLDLKDFHVFGGSWGSTLALAYAQHSPNRCKSLALRGIFMMRQKEIDWFMEGMGIFFPDAFAEFKSLFPDVAAKDLLHHFYQALTGDDEDFRLKASFAWSRFEASCCALVPNEEMINSCDNPDLAYPISLMEAHYFIHNKFNPDDALLQNAHLIRHLPCTIVQGRYDIVCPPVSAWELAKALPDARLEIIPDAGHSSMDPGIAKALIETMNRYKHIT